MRLHFNVITLYFHKLWYIMIKYYESLTIVIMLVNKHLQQLIHILSPAQTLITWNCTPYYWLFSYNSTRHCVLFLTYSMYTMHYNRINLLCILNIGIFPPVVKYTALQECSVSMPLSLATAFSRLLYFLFFLLIFFWFPSLFYFSSERQLPSLIETKLFLVIT